MPSAGGRRRTDPDAHRRRVGRALLAAAVVLFALALVLPIDLQGRYAGWQAVGRLVATAWEDAGPGRAVRTVVRLTALQVAGSFVVAVAALICEFRTFSRLMATALVALMWAVVGVVFLNDPRTIDYIGRLARNGPGAFTWFAAHVTLAAAGFVWPRPSPSPS